MKLAGEFGGRGSGDPRVHRWGDDVADFLGAGCLARELGRRPRRLGRRTVLRDGPGQALGPHREGRQAARRRRGRPPCRRRSGVREAYERGETDEFIAPTTVGDEARIRPGDSVIAFNFRPDRMRQITEKLTETVNAT